MYPYYRSGYPLPDQRFFGWGLGLPLVAGGLGFLGGLLGGALVSRPFYGYPGFGYPGGGYPGVGYPGFGGPMGFGGYPYFY